MYEIKYCDLPEGEYFYFNEHEYHKIGHGCVVDDRGKFVDFGLKPKLVKIDNDRYERIFG